jgi:hypothetical protein
LDSLIEMVRTPCCSGGLLLAYRVCYCVDGPGRYDLQLPEFVIDELRLDSLLSPITALLATIMRTSPVPSMRTHNVVFAPVHSPSQQWHYDDTSDQRKPYRYFTILIHLNALDKGCGGTEIWMEASEKGDLVSEPVYRVVGCWASHACMYDRCALAQATRWCSLATSCIVDRRTWAKRIASSTMQPSPAAMT